ncbi:MAG: glycosyltransferase family 25 protein [Pseudomonadota bacterium]
MAQHTTFPVYVISCAQDKARRARALASCAAFGLHVRLIKAVDARDGLTSLRPYRDLVAHQFWSQDQIKPGAFACFISHRLAWAALVDHDAPVALILEDDSRVVAVPRWDGISQLSFCNDRLLEWDHKVGGLHRVMSTSRAQFEGLAKAPGADGYILTQDAAKLLLEATDREGVRCGVDWYLMMMAAGLPKGQSYLSEVKSLRDMFGLRSPVLKAAASDHVMVRNDRAGPSSIEHAKTVPIAAFKDALV